MIVVGGVAALVLGAMALENMPTLTQMGLSVVQGPTATPPSPETNPEPSIPDQNSPPVSPEIAETSPPPPAEAEPAPARPKPVRPPRVVPKPKQTREMATEEFDSERGRELFAKMKRVVIVRGDEFDPALMANDPAAAAAATATAGADTKNRNKGRNNRNTPNGDNTAAMTYQDPMWAIWSETLANSERVIEKMGLEASKGKPGREAAVLTITLDMQESEKGKPGTMELSISAELTCADPSSDKRSVSYAKVWKAEQDLGTVSAKSSQLGKLPNSVESQMTKFFGKFRGAYNQAVQATKDADEAG